MEVSSLCEQLGCLPDAGGLLDQDPYWVNRLSLYHEIRAEYENIQRKKQQRARHN